MTKQHRILTACLLATAAISACPPQICAQSDATPREWLKRVRIAAYPLTTANAEAIVQQANDSHVYGIEVDNDIPGRYESLLHPEAKLAAIRKVATAAHAHGQKAFVYIAGTECITSASHADSGDAEHTLAKDHPEWLQRKKTGQPAIFDNTAAFWIAKGEEDAWISPFAADWRKLYMHRVRQIAATGIDGIYVDIPYWMTHFTGWEDSWASFDTATLAAFRQQTGLDATKDVDLGNFDDPGFRKWIDFRIATITQFLAEIRANAVAVNPKISLIPEIYPGIEQEAVRVGADVYQLYPVVDAIAHEYEFGAGDDHTAASRPPFDWMMYQIGMRSFRAFAGDKPTWILNYSWDGAPHVPAAEAMQTLFMSELMAGANVWDPQGHVMSGSNDLAERKRVYSWIAQHEDLFGQSRTPIGDVGVYFSETTRNYDPKDFLASYRGTLLMLLQAHRQFQIVTPRTLAVFRGTTLILPGVRIASDDEAGAIRRFAAGGGQVILDGKSDAKLETLHNAIQLQDDPAGSYLARAKKDFASATADPRNALLSSLPAAAGSSAIRWSGSTNLVGHASVIGKRTCIFFANFQGIVAGVNLVPVSQKNVSVEVPYTFGKTMHLLPFLGEALVLQGKSDGDRTTFVIPQIERGAVVWFE